MFLKLLRKKNEDIIMIGICGKCGCVHTDVTKSIVMISEVGTVEMLLCIHCKKDMENVRQISYKV